MRHELTRLLVPMTEFKFNELKKQGGKIMCKVSEEFISLLPEQKDWDRIRFANGEQFKEYEFEGIEVKLKSIVFHLGDQKLKSI